MLKPSIVSALIGLSAQVYAQISTVCPADNGVCYGLNIPSTTASNGDGDIFFQISAPTSFQWVGLGQGSSMSGANIFVIYASADGSNVTLSTRRGTGHTEPQFSSNAQVSLLEGSGIVNGKMIANVKCSNCNSWSGGTMDFSGSQGNWIHASRSGSAFSSDDTSASISQHSDDYGAFQWSFASAKGGSSVNPFTTSSGVTTGAAGTTSCVPRPTTGTFADAALATTTWPSSMPSSLSTAWPTQFPSQWKTNWPSAYPTGKRNHDNDDDDNDKKKRYVEIFNRQDSNINYCDSSDSSNGGNNSGLTIISGGGASTTMLMAHGIMAALAFVIFFPFGSISIRLLSFPGVVWFHGLFQILAYLLYTAAFGIGVYLANNMGYMKNHHPIIGIVVFVMLFFQPILGVLHHSGYKRFSRRTVWSHAHIWVGRIGISLGIINGGLGLKLANNTNSGKIAYAIVAAVVWLVWVAAAAWGEIKRNKAPPKYDGTRLESMERNRDENGGFYPPPGKERR